MKETLVFTYKQSSSHKGEYSSGQKCKILGITYQDCGPVAWALNIETGMVVGTNPSNLRIYEKDDQCPA